MKGLIARLKAGHAYRSWTRYGEARGNLLAGGLTFVGFFSVLPALILGFTVFGFVLRGHPELFQRVVASVSDLLPGVVRDAQHPDGLLDAAEPPTPDALTVAGLISLVTLVLAGLGWVDAIRQGVRAMFDLPRLRSNPVLGKLRDLGLLALLGVPLLASAALSVVANAAASWTLRQLGLSDSGAGQWVLRVVGVLVALAADFLLMIILLRVMSGLRIARSDVARAALLGAVGIGVLKLASGLLLASASRKPLLAGFAVVVGLLVLMNLLSRLVLLAAAWAATTLHESGRLPSAQPPAPLPRPAGPREASLPSFGPRSADRTAVAAGAVLGVTAAVAARTVRRGLRAAVDAVRGR